MATQSLQVPPGLYGGFITDQIVGDIRISDFAGLMAQYYNVRSNIVDNEWGVVKPVDVISLTNTIDAQGNLSSVSVADVLYTKTWQEIGPRFLGRCTVTVNLPVSGPASIGLVLIDEASLTVVYDTQGEHPFLRGGMVIQGATAPTPTPGPA